ncbi:transposase [Pseudomonas sp. IT-P294]
MQLGFDRQHFTLPRVGIFLGLNKWLPVARQTLFDKSWASVKFLFEFVVKGLVTDQFHLVRIVGRLRHLGVAWSIHAPRRPTSCSR